MMQPSAANLPDRIDKYQITTKLGMGAQGLVLKAFDESLHRAVAIKLLREKIPTSSIKNLVKEARIVSQLEHPNTITLLDFGYIKNKPYLVFEFVDGVTLQELLKQEKSLGVRRAVIIMSQILGAMALAHERGIIHKDLSPANVMITKSGIPKVMDFGLSTLGTTVASADEEIVGSLRYMHPEGLLRGTVGPHSDVFALGSMFFEMLVGEFQFAQSSQDAVIDAILTADPRLPSSVSEDIAPILDSIVGTALQRNPENRFRDAGQMKALLDEYRVPRTKEESVQPSALPFLLRRVNRNKGFLAVSNSVNEILGLMSESSLASAQTLSNVLAKDVTLAQHVLTMANSAMYGNQQIDTLSRAIVLLGENQVRTCVTSALVEKEFSQGSPELRKALITGFFSGMLAKEILRSLNINSAESAFLAGTFHNLGLMLIIHYMSEEYEEISALIENGENRFTAERAVLGAASFELGMEVARSWNLPAPIVDSMRPLPRGDVAAATSREELIPLIAAFSNALAESIETDGIDAVPARQALIDKMGNLAPFTVEELDPMILRVTEYTQKYGRLIRVNPQDSALLSLAAQ